MAKYLHNNCQTGLNKGGFRVKDEQKATQKDNKSKIFLHFLSSQVDIKETVADVK